MKIAIVEDDKVLASKIAKKLEKNWYEVITSNSVWDFKKSVLDNADLFILDLWLGESSWFEIIKWLRDEKRNSSPILVMSWYADIDTKLKWFNLWIDDYICKPVIPDELLARVYALLRRWSSLKEEKIEYNNLVFDFRTREVLNWDETIILNRKEFQIVEYFLINKWKFIEKSELIKSVWWNMDLLDVTFNTINVTICKLRKKLWDNFNLETKVWMGYILK